jgi:hypothetical protein
MNGASHATFPPPPAGGRQVRAANRKGKGATARSTASGLPHPDVLRTSTLPLQGRVRL